MELEMEDGEIREDPVSDFSKPSESVVEKTRKNSTSLKSPKNARFQGAFTGCSKFDDYEIILKIGEGTFGEVSRAKNVHSGSIVALKKILIHSEKEGMPITAIREIKILKGLKHPNIVTLIEMAFERGEKSKCLGNFYMVFPFLDHDLTGVLENPNINLTQPQIKCYCSQLLHGISYLHKKNILHRDIKCSNILIDNAGHLKIADFGLARSYIPEKSEKEYTNNVVTRWYRPIELFFGEKKYNSSIDMWAVGCVIAEIFKRRPIFPGDSDFNQLEVTFISLYLSGTPLESDMAWLKQLPGAKDFIESFNEPKPCIFRNKFAAFDPLAIDLIDRLLQYSPKKRFTAEQALAHAYFSKTPAAAVPGPANFSDFPSSHEYSTRKMIQKQMELHKHVQGSSRTNFNPKPHYADEKILRMYENYNSFKLEPEVPVAPVAPVVHNWDWGYKSPASIERTEPKIVTGYVKPFDRYENKSVKRFKPRNSSPIRNKSPLGSLSPLPRNDNFKPVQRAEHRKNESNRLLNESNRSMSNDPPPRNDNFKPVQRVDRWIKESNQSIESNRSMSNDKFPKRSRSRSESFDKNISSPKKSRPKDTYRPNL